MRAWAVTEGLTIEHQGATATVTLRKRDEVTGRIMFMLNDRRLVSYGRDQMVNVVTNDLGKVGI